MGIVEDELAGPSVFRDRSVLDFDFVPEKLPHRDAELRTLGSIFRPVLTGEAAENVYVTGAVGTGKTVLTRKFSQELKDACHKAGRRLDVDYVNCRVNAAEALVLTEVLNSITGHYPSKGFSTNEMLRDLRTNLVRRESDLLLLLDEADALLQKAGSNLIYQFTRFGQGDAKGPRVHLILVSMREDIMDGMDEATRSSFKRSNVLKLEKYTEGQLADILRERSRLGFQRGTVPEDALELIAEIAAAEGDARYAIELLEHAGRLADADRTGQVEGEHVRAANVHTRSFVTEAKLKLLGRQQLFILLAIARRLKKTRKAFATTGEVEGVYMVVCEENGEAPRAHTQFWKYLKELETAGWLGLRKSQSGTAGKTQQLSLPAGPAALLLEKVEEVLAKGAKKSIA